MYPCTHIRETEISVGNTCDFKKITYRNFKWEARIPVTRSWSAANPQAMK